MNRREDYIAVFDSGVGGISVLRHLRKQMPGERFLYYGDSANAPYGTRSADEVRALTLDAVDRLMDRGLKALVVACNTATAAAIGTLRQRYPQMIVVGIEPALKVAAEHYPGGRVGVMATPVTLRQEKFNRLLQRFGGECQVSEIPAPGLVELIESGQGESEQTEQFLQNLLQPWMGRLDALVLGCTHYPFASASIRKVLGDGVELLDGGIGTARETRRRLENADLLERGPGEIILENSLNTPQILALSRSLLGAERP